MLLQGWRHSVGSASPSQVGRVQHAEHEPAVLAGKLCPLFPTFFVSVREKTMHANSPIQHDCLLTSFCPPTVPAPAYAWQCQHPSVPGRQLSFINPPAKMSAPHASTVQASKIARLDLKVHDANSHACTQPPPNSCSSSPWGAVTVFCICFVWGLGPLCVLLGAPLPAAPSLNDCGSLWVTRLGVGM